MGDQLLPKGALNRLSSENIMEGLIVLILICLEIKAPGIKVVKVPLVNKAAEKLDGVSVLEWSGSAVDEGPSVADWFSNYLGKPSRLVRFNDGGEVRPTDPDYARGYKIMFSDMYPFLLLSQGSLDVLNSLLKEPVPVNRFRPNIVVDGCEAFDEDVWTEIQINNTTFQGVKLCSRCKVPTINQESGIKGCEPMETLLRFRSDKTLRPSKKEQKGRVYFGQNLVCVDSVNEDGRSIKVGDAIRVIKKVASADEAAA